MEPPRLSLVPSSQESNDNGREDAGDEPRARRRRCRATSLRCPLPTIARSCASSKRCCSPPPSRSMRPSSPRIWPSRRRWRADRGAARLLRRPRRQSRQGGRQVGVPHRRGSRLSAGALRHAGAPPVEGRARDAVDHRLPPAGDARRDRGDPRRNDVGRHARHPAGDRMGAPARPPPGARAPRHLRHHGYVPLAISAWKASRICRASPSCAPPGCSTAICRLTSPCPIPPTLPP